MLMLVWLGHVLMLLLLLFNMIKGGVPEALLHKKAARVAVIVLTRHSRSSIPSSPPEHFVFEFTWPH